MAQIGYALRLHHPCASLRTRYRRCFFFCPFFLWAHVAGWSAVFCSLSFGFSSMLCIIGSRSFSDSTVFESALRTHFALHGTPSALCTAEVAGTCALARSFAQLHNIPLTVHHANWRRLGRSAGLVRSRAMLATATSVVAFYDGFSPGTAHEIAFARSLGLPVFLIATGSTTPFLF